MNMNIVRYGDWACCLVNVISVSSLSPTRQVRLVVRKENSDFVRTIFDQVNQTTILAQDKLFFCSAFPEAVFDYTSAALTYRTNYM